MIFCKIYFLATSIEPIEAVNPCQPSPCGPNSICQPSASETPSCQCMPDFIGSPPNCRPECVSNNECSQQLACINKKCQNPCIQACGSNAECRVVSHTAACVCPEGYTGDAAIQCTLNALAPIETLSPCSPSPCGSNAECRENTGAGACVCISGYFGDPYEGCRPECIVNSDCPSNRACTRNKCTDPCPGTCAINADCQVVNHSPLCTCRPMYTGDPFRYCTIKGKPERHTNE